MRRLLRKGVRNYLKYENGAFVKSESFTKMSLDNGYFTDIEVPDNFSWQLWDRGICV